MNFSLKLIWLLILSLNFFPPHAFASMNETMDESVQTIEKIKELEKRFVVALDQTHPQYFEGQKKLLNEAFETYQKAIQLALKKPSQNLIQAVVKLADILMDNDPSESTSAELFTVYSRYKEMTSKAIEQLEASSAKKIKSAMRARKEIAAQSKAGKQP